MIREMRRSALYVPGDSVRMIEKAALVSADVLLLNLEDGVAAALKEAARDNVVRALRSGSLSRRETVVRVNLLRTETGARDLAAVVPESPDGICLPKVESVGDVLAAEAAVQDLERIHVLPVGSIRLHAMIESAAGVLKAPEIASASGRMASLIFGSADYAADLRCRVGPERHEFALALQLIVLAARAAGIHAIDAPCFALSDGARLEFEARQARSLGFDGKSALHPNQLDIINAAFDVSDEDVQWALRTLAELDSAEARGKALGTIDGVLVDNPHRTAADRILRLRAITGQSPKSPS